MHWVFKAKKEKGQLESYLFCIWLTLSQYITQYKSDILSTNLCLPKRNFLIYITHISKFKMNTTLISWTCVEFLMTINIEITSGHKEIKQRVCFKGHENPGGFCCERHRNEGSAIRYKIPQLRFHHGLNSGMEHLYSQTSQFCVILGLEFLGKILKYIPFSK